MILTIRFIGAYDITSKLIEWSTNSLWCHTEALSRDGSTWIGAHAFTGVQARPLDWCKTTVRVATYAVVVSDTDYERSMTWLEHRIGTKYDYTGVFGLAVHKRINGDAPRVDCSMLMLGYLMLAGLQPLNCLESYAYLVTPETLHLSPLFIGRGVASPVG
jgi:hypothetical protein